jgi:hypothetical protein
MCLPQIRSSLEQMKFIVNHSYKFEQPYSAFISALMHLIAAVSIELLNMLSILQTNGIMEFVRDFTALVIIEQFEVFLTAALDEGCLLKLISHPGFRKTCLMIERTSSSKREDERAKKLKGIDEQQELPVVVNLLERGYWELVGYLMYKLLKLLYVSVWFYYLPIIMFYALYFVPYLILRSA